ncbi:MAG TPA: PilZ domain-containing protein [Gemmataceae bacterium]|nr:PilZ domain-containing protein [Gemmataceae bacterium]
MFERLLSSITRLVGPCETAGERQVVASDRRVWVRYPCNALVSCQPAADDTENLLARVINVSRGGIGLLVDRELEPGRFLGVELPAPSPFPLSSSGGRGGESGSRVLAYVLHVTPLSGGQWAAGCAFSDELSDADLQAFGARRQKPIEEDQRAWVRFPCPVQASYQVIRGIESAPRPARVVDISACGIGLEVGRSLEVGTLLSLEMRGAGQETVLTILASVVRVTPQPDGCWRLGCNFIRELTEEELQALL